MKRIWRRAAALLSVSYAHHAEYRMEIFLWALSGLLPFISMGVWMQASGQGALPLETVDIARYFLAVFLVRQFTVVWVIWEFEYDVVQGRLSPLLLQPIDPAWRYLATHVAERLTRLPLLVVMVAGFFVLYPQAIWRPSLSSLLLTAAAVATAFVMRFLMQYTFAMLAFWTERASAIDRLFMIPQVFLSGYIAPLEFFPPLAQTIALWTPFPYLVYFPARILMGQPVNLAAGFTIMLLWCGVFFGLNRLMWRLGLRHYSAMGA